MNKLIQYLNSYYNCQGKLDYVAITNIPRSLSVFNQKRVDLSLTPQVTS